MFQQTAALELFVFLLPVSRVLSVTVYLVIPERISWEVDAWEVDAWEVDSVLSTVSVTTEQSVKHITRTLM